MSKFAIHYQKIRKPDIKHLEQNYIDINYRTIHADPPTPTSATPATPASAASATATPEPPTIYNPYHIKHLQCYNPIYDLFFEMNENNYDTIGLNHKYHLYDLTHIINKNEISDTPETKEAKIFIKFSPLLDTVRYLIGKYKNPELLKNLPKHSTQSSSSSSHPKLENLNNSSYIDNFFCYLSSQLLNEHEFPHAINYYGSFMGIQEKFKMSVADDIEYLLQSEYFKQNKGKIYEIEQHEEDNYTNFGSRANKHKLIIHNQTEISVISLDYLTPQESTDTNIDLELEQGDDIEPPKDIQEMGECIFEHEVTHSDTSSMNSSNNSELNYSDDENENENDSSTEWEDEDETNEEISIDTEENSNNDDNETDTTDDELQIHAFIYDFPVQMICLEKCKGTIDQLFMKNKLPVEKAASALFQIIMTLLVYQKAFYFTHNDLHTNNIMYIETDQEFITYKYSDTYYRVPTYGKIFKIIDYGRAIYRFQGKTFCSDSFAPGGDAYTQYNFGQFFNENKPRLEPNYSFDLSRLGCSIYDILFENENIDEETNGENTLNDLQKIILKWVSDDNGKNILYKKNGEERYPNFKLYKMIARTVHHCEPSQQLKEPYFAQFLFVPGTQETLTDIIDIDQIPCYAQ
jgi:hypothetical protein